VWFNFIARPDGDKEAARPASLFPKSAFRRLRARQPLRQSQPERPIDATSNCVPMTLAVVARPQRRLQPTARQAGNRASIVAGERHLLDEFSVIAKAPWCGASLRVRPR